MFMKNIYHRELSDPGLYICSCILPLFSKIFSETALPIKAKFHVAPIWERGKKLYINCPGHMTKVAAMPIYGKKTLKISSPTEVIVL